MGRVAVDIAAAVGPLLPRRDRHAGLVLELPLHALLVTCGRKGQLQVGTLGGLAGVPEAIDHRRRQRQQAAPRRGPFDRLDPQMESPSELVDGLDVLDAGYRTRRVMVLQSLPDAR